MRYSSATIRWRWVSYKWRAGKASRCPKSWLSSVLTACLRFNSISDYLFRPIAERIRLVTFDARDPAQSSERQKFDHLVRVNYKFMSYARESVLTVLGKTFYRTVFLA
jgi:hypothetical protein